MKIGLQRKHLVFQSGGNSTYARMLASGLSGIPDVEVVLFGPQNRSSRVRRALGQVAEGLQPALPSDVDVYHYTSDTGPILPSRGAAIVTTIHGMASAHLHGVRSVASERVWRSRVGHAVRLSRAIVTVSESSRRDLVEHLGADPNRIVVIPHGVNHERFNPRGPSWRPTCAGGAPYLLYLGNLEPRKNLVRAVHAFAASELRRQGWVFLIAGRLAWRHDGIVAAITGTPRVAHLGFVEDERVPALLRGASGFFFPSLYEGFGLPPLEAMACGTPVVTSRAGSLSEVVGEAAIVVEPESVESMVHGLDVLLDSEGCDRLRRSGLARAATFQWERSVQKHVDVYGSMSL